ncbi:MAG: PQQ-dependent sugar dehydrogenase, partial [Anaerolineae bacterium]|nr:PQQ-dependent sugar dehydrogenase [Anaerolineae bacterium]
GVLQPEPFLDIRDRVSDDSTETGLLGLAFHPDYEENGLFYVNYTTGDRTHISRFSVSATNPDMADPAAEQVLISVRQPAPNHNGGQLAFGPDGYLYIGLGDGGAAGDLFGNGQNIETLLGAILRIDVNAGDPYAVPADNPFVQMPSARPELWAIGLRNPWRFSFDRLTGDLYIADVGQNRLEEVNVQPAASPGGENYGWPIMEAMSCFDTETCVTDGLTLPVLEYSHDEGCSITGGYVYRGAARPDLAGVYFYGDFCYGTVWGARPGPGERWESAELASVGNLSSFGEDESGELYATDLGSGTLYRLTS